MNEIEEELTARLTALEEFVAGMSRRVIYARGEAMAATFCLAEIVNIIGGELKDKKFSIGDALISADAALDQERGTADPKTQAAIDHARLLLKSMQINLSSPHVRPIRLPPSLIRKTTA